MPIYTRTGDNGTTALFGGKRVLKCEELVDVYGSIDELNSWIGFVISTLKDKEVKDFLFTTQSDLLLIGSVMAGWIGDLSPLNGRIREMEKQIDMMEKRLPQLTNFILPGGSREASAIHITRSICRRVERQAVAFSQKETIDPLIIKYFNRLSDLFYVFARFINKMLNVPEVVWNKKTKN